MKNNLKLTLLFLIFLFVIFFRLIYIVNLKEVYLLKEKKITNLNSKIIYSRDFNFFRENIEIFEATPEIEANLRTIFKSHRLSNDEYGIATKSSQLLIKLLEAKSSIDIINFSNRIITDKYSLQPEHALAVNRIVKVYLKKKKIKLAFKYLCLGFSCPRTPHPGSFRYFFKDLLEVTKLFIFSSNNLAQIQKIESLLIQAKKNSKFNLDKKNTIIDLKLELYKFDYLIFLCKQKLNKNRTKLKSQLIFQLKKILQLNYILTLSGYPYFLKKEVFYLKAMLNFISSDCKTAPPHKRMTPKFFVRKSKIYSFFKFLLLKDEYSIFEAL